LGEKEGEYREKQDSDQLDRPVPLRLLTRYRERKLAHLGFANLDSVTLGRVGVMIFRKSKRSERTAAVGSEVG